MILVGRKPGQNSLIAYCAMISLTWFDDCGFLFLNTL